jgi:hypothetical protein
MNDMKKQAKLAVLKHIRQMASDVMKDDMKGKGFKKVTVASDSKEGLEEGLEKAKELVGKPDLAAALEKESKDEDEAEDTEEEEAEDMEESEMSPEEEAAEGDPSDTPDSLDAQIKALQDKKHKLLLK